MLGVHWSTVHPPPKYRNRELQDTGEPDAVKAARPVLRGADGKVLRAIGVTRRRPTRHQDRRVRLREGQLPAAGADGGGSSRAPPPLPGQAQPASPARLVGGLALGAGHRQRGDSAPSVGGRLRLQLLPQGREAQGRPVRRGGVGSAHAAQGGVRWIGR